MKAQISISFKQPPGKDVCVCACARVRARGGGEGGRGTFRQCVRGRHEARHAAVAVGALLCDGLPHPWAPPIPAHQAGAHPCPHAVLENFSIGTDL